METVGNIAGPLLAYEVLTAFFLEAVFLGIMLFGMSKVPPWLHTSATALVAIGTTSSAFWILVLNSWMHTPAGFEMRDGVAHATDWLAVVFNPSLPYRFSHMLLASTLTCAFLMAGVSAYRLLRKLDAPDARLSLKAGVLIAAIAGPMQLLVGDLHGLNTLEHQPQKVAAMEGNWETGPAKPLLLFALIDETARANQFEIAIPYGASLILKHDINGVIPGLNQYVDDTGKPLHPPVSAVFYAFRIMVGLGVLMIASAWLAQWMIMRSANRLPSKWMLRFLVGMTFSGWVAVLAGWYTTEIGRQPWLVTGVLPTSAAAGSVGSTEVALTLTMYVLLYAMLLAAFIGALFHQANQDSKPVSISAPGVADDTAAPRHSLDGAMNRA